MKNLVIASAYKEAGGIDKEGMEEQVKKARQFDLFVDVLYDPSQYLLERSIKENEYDSIYASTIFSFTERDGRIVKRDYNILAVLERFNQNFIGSDAFTQLLTQDKSICSMRSNIGINGFIVSRATFEKDPQRVYGSLSKVALPVLIKPNTLYGSMGINENSIVYDDRYITKTITEQFARFPRLSECWVEEFMENAREFTVGLIGRDDYFLTSVTEIQKIGDTKLYDETEKDKPINTRGIMYKCLKDSQLHRKLSECSKSLFRDFKLKDYARIDFLLKKSLKLIEVNGLPVIGNSMTWEWQEKYGLKKEDILSCLFAFSYFQMSHEGKVVQIPNKVLTMLPGELISSIQRAANQVSPIDELEG